MIEVTMQAKKIPHVHCQTYGIGIALD